MFGVSDFWTKDQNRWFSNRLLLYRFGAFHCDFGEWNQAFQYGVRGKISLIIQIFFNSIPWNFQTISIWMQGAKQQIF